MPKLYPVIWIDSKDYVTSQVQHLTEKKGAKSLIEGRTSQPMFTQAGWLDRSTSWRPCIVNHYFLQDYVSAIEVTILPQL